MPPSEPGTYIDVFCDVCEKVLAIRKQDYTEGMPVCDLVSCVADHQVSMPRWCPGRFYRVTDRS